MDGLLPNDLFYLNFEWDWKKNPSIPTIENKPNIYTKEIDWNEFGFDTQIVW